MNSQSDCIEFCKILADPTRQQILQLLLEKERSVNEIVASFSLSQPTISHHLEVLTRMGLLSSRKDGKQIYYQTDKKQVTWCCGQLMAKFNPGAKLSEPE